MIHARSVPTGHIHALLANLTSLHSRRPASLHTQIDEKPITTQISTLTISQLIGHTAWKLYPPQPYAGASSAGFGFSAGGKMRRWGHGIRGMTCLNVCSR